MKNIFCISLIILLFSTMSGCFMQKLLSEQPSYAAKKTKLSKKKHHKLVSITIPVESVYGEISLNADVYRPYKKALPKTLVILVPGSGNVSRKGEVEGNGIDSYPQSLEQSTLWAQALADEGFFVLSYDKRTCMKQHNSLCKTNPQIDVDEEGIGALAGDLDRVFDFAASRLGSKKEGARIILMSSTQGAQIISLSKSSRKADGIVLLSPIIGDLEESWVMGLRQAYEQETNQAKKNQFLNQAESIKSFFSILSKGDFPDKANIKGASVAFWRSWKKASKQTYPRLIDLRRPVFMLFSEQDVFSLPKVVDELGVIARKHKKIKVKMFSQADRSFFIDNALDKSALKSVVEFISKTPIIRP